MSAMSDSTVGDSPSEEECHALSLLDGRWILRWTSSTRRGAGALGPFEVVVRSGRFVGLEERGSVLVGTFRILASGKLQAKARISPLLSPPDVLIRDAAGGFTRRPQSYSVEFDAVDLAAVTELVATLGHGQSVLQLSLRKVAGTFN